MPKVACSPFSFIIPATLTYCKYYCEIAYNSKLTLCLCSNNYKDMAYINFLFDQICPRYIKEHSLNVSVQSDLIYGNKRKG